MLKLEKEMNIKKCMFAIILGILPIVSYANYGNIIYIKGSGFVQNEKGILRIEKSMQVREGDKIVSDKESFVQIKMKDGGVFSIRENTEFIINKYVFNGIEDKEEKAEYSIVKGSLRAVTGLIGKKHRENYKVSTPTSVIGIRGSGADIGHNEIIGTAVKTLFGGHVVTSNGKTIETNVGQIVLVKPNGFPEYVKDFPFSLSDGEENKIIKTEVESKEIFVNNMVNEKETIVIKSEEGFDFINNKYEKKDIIGSGVAFSGLAADNSIFSNFHLVDNYGTFKPKFDNIGNFIGWNKYNNNVITDEIRCIL